MRCYYVILSPNSISLSFSVYSLLFLFSLLKYWLFSLIFNYLKKSFFSFFPPFFKSLMFFLSRHYISWVSASFISLLFSSLHFSLSLLLPSFPFRSLIILVAVFLFVSSYTNQSALFSAFISLLLVFVLCPFPLPPHSPPDSFCVHR